MRMTVDKVIRAELLALLKGGNAHMGIDEALSGFPVKEINRRVPNASYTVWHLLEHMRIVQWDIIGFVLNAGHISPDFPEGYWPGIDEMATVLRWKKTLKGFRDDLKSAERLVNDPKTDFFSPIPHAMDYTIFRELLLIADHNAFHTGELVTLRRVLDMRPVKEY
jgi:hypothetical protein